MSAPSVAPHIDAVRQQLAPTGTLRAGINLSNFLLVTGKASNGDPVGVAPDMAAEIARRLGVAVAYVTFPQPGPLADKVDTDTWDIGLIGAEPQRAEKIAFTRAYVEIRSTYMVPPGSTIQSIVDVDKPGVRISVTGRSAYGLWLERNIKHAMKSLLNLDYPAYTVVAVDDRSSDRTGALRTQVEAIIGPFLCDEHQFCNPPFGEAFGLHHQ